MDQFKHDNGVLLTNYDLEDLGEDNEYKLYAEFSEESDGELAKELVQTWICDNRLDVNSCIRIALENRKQPFCNWYRDSEKYTSPDELLLYCLGKQTNKHVSIFNNKYVWSTLANHIRYDYFEILQHSHVILVMLGERHYAIFRKKKAIENTNTKDAPKNKRRDGGRGCGRGRGKKSTDTKKKTVCRSSSSRDRTARTTIGTGAMGTRSHTLESARKEKYGIGKVGSKSVSTPDTEKYSRGKCTRGHLINYQKLNEGLEEVDDIPSSPKKAKHLPGRSGPTQHRQSAQKQTTENPLVRTLSTVKSKKDTAEEKETKQTAKSKQSVTLIGVPPITTTETTSTSTLAGVPPTSTNEAVPPTASVGTKDVFLGVPEMDNLLLPNLGLSNEPTIEDVINQSTNTDPPPDVNTTENELDTADALLSLSNTRDTGLNLDADLGMEDNALLVPIGGQAVCEDIAPMTSRLSPIEVDSEIARIIDAEEQPVLTTPPPPTPLLDVQDADTTPLVGIQDAGTTKKQLTTTKQEQSTIDDITKDSGETVPQPAVDHSSKPLKPTTADNSTELPEASSGARPKEKQTGTRAAFKSQLYGLRRKVPKDRAYKCQICGKLKRSMEALNDHHRR